jgi:hypothetical protein
MNSYCCPNCGYNINYGDRYCGNCGTAIYYSGEMQNKYCMPFGSRNCNNRVINRSKPENIGLHNPGISRSSIHLQKNNIDGSINAPARPIRNEIFKLLSDLLTE